MDKKWKRVLYIRELFGSQTVCHFIRYLVALYISMPSYLADGGLGTHTEYIMINLQDVSGFLFTVYMSWLWELRFSSLTIDGFFPFFTAEKHFTRACFMVIISPWYRVDLSVIWLGHYLTWALSCLNRPFG